MAQSSHLFQQCNFISFYVYIRFSLKKLDCCYCGVKFICYISDYLIVRNGCFIGG